MRGRLVKRLRDIEHQMFRLQKLCLYTALGTRPSFYERLIARAGRTTSAGQEIYEYILIQKYTQSSILIQLGCSSKQMGANEDT